MKPVESIRRQRVLGVVGEKEGHTAADVLPDFIGQGCAGGELLVGGKGEDGGDGEAGALDDDGLAGLVNLVEQLGKAGVSFLDVQVLGHCDTF